MQKLLKRTAQAEKQVRRRAAVDLKRSRARNRRQALGSEVEANAEIRQNMRDARQALRDAWELGPIAPKRELGFNDHGVMKAGMRRDFTAFGRRDLRPKLLKERCAWAGGVNQLCLVPGDRVVILEGPDKGKIDTLKEVDVSSGTVQLNNHHRAVFEGFLSAPPSEAPLPLPINAIRLVYPLVDPQTNVARDRIIQELKPIKANMSSPTMTYERWEYGQRFDRLVPGLNVVIPWPAVEAPELKTHDVDTTRVAVEERTYHYNLLSSPIPEGVMAELRNPYSRFRTRHEPEYIAKKEAEAAAKKAKGVIPSSMQTPLDEFHEMNKELKALRGEPEMSDEMLTKLGEIMAQRQLEKGGVKVESKAEK